MKLWGGRFSKDLDKVAEHFHSSISFDHRLYKCDIKGSIAHARMLGRQGIIPPDEAEIIIGALTDIEKDIEVGNVVFEESAEDVHMNIEKILIERIGDIGKKLHTARSRNDQVALDIRMYLKEELKAVCRLLIGLQQVLLDKAKEHKEVILPGYTHMQKAQPVLFAHHLLAYFEMFQRDVERLRDTFKRVDYMPLGSGALAGTTFPIDREAVKEELGFGRLTRNSIDAVSDRDFVVEAVFDMSLIMMHLSRFCEEIILWSTEEFRFVEVDDAYGTGSSIMPQKKNPDVAELVRGKTGRVYGDLVALLSMMKSLPLAYNKDMQEDKESLFDALDTVKGCLKVFVPMVATMQIRAENMYRGAKGGFSNATDAADYLVGKGLPFRDAHRIVGKMVAYCIEKGITLEEITLDKLKEFHPIISESIYPVLQIENSVKRRDVAGGTGNKRVQAAMEEAQRIINANDTWDSTN